MGKIRKSESGLSLIETLMGMGAISGIMLAMLAMNEVQNKSLKTSRISSTRDNLRNLLERYVQDRGILETSAEYRGTNDAGNIALDYCLNGPPAIAEPGCPMTTPRNCCVIRSASSPQPFVLLDPTLTTDQIRISGTDQAIAPLAPVAASPIYYDADGALCAGPGSNCPIEVVTSFISTCAGGATQCERAESLNLRYTVRKSSAAGGPTFKTVTRTVPMGGYGVGSGKVTSTSTGGEGSNKFPVTLPNKMDFTTPGTVDWPVPPGHDLLLITVVGGGGGGSRKMTNSSTAIQCRGQLGQNSVVTVGGKTITAAGGGPAGVPPYAVGTGGGVTTYIPALYPFRYDFTWNAYVFPGQSGISSSRVGGESYLSAMGLPYGRGANGSGYGGGAGGGETWLNVPVSVSEGEIVQVTVGAGGECQRIQDGWVRIAY